MKAHVCIGGPLDGQHAISSDFWQGGMYHHLEREYLQFNNAARAWNRTGAHVAWIHTSLLKPSITPKHR